jgi:ParB family chromosome partitioning protein
VAARRRAEREAKAAQHSGVGAGPDRVAATEQSNVPAKAPAKPSNQTPPRVAQYRLQKWRTWAANRLMALPEKNHRLLAALVLSCDTQAIDTGKYAEVVAKLTKGKAGNNTFKGALEQCSVFDADAMPSVVAAVAAAAAYGLDPGNLELLLNYLDVNEAVHFTLDAEYLDLLTVSELESLADELKLKRAMGESYKKARAGKKSDFIAALLAAPGVSYAGLVPRAMRYPRRKLKTAETDRDRAAVPSTDPQPSTTADEPSAETPTAAEV